MNLLALSIRPAVSADVGAVLKVIRSAVLETSPAAYGHHAAQAMAEYYTPRRIETGFKTGQYSVALSGTQVLGVAGTAQRSNSNSELVRLFVCPSVHGRGVGRSLLEQQLAALQATQPAHASLVAYALTPSIPFYCANGFASEEPVPTSFGAATVTVTPMRKLIHL